MNQILLRPTECDSVGRYIINTGDYRFEHLVKVLRAETGTLLRCCVPGFKRFIARIDELNVNFCVLIEQDDLPLYKPWCHLVVGLSRPPTMRKIIEHGTCMGVASFDFVRSSLSEKSYLQSNVLQEDSWQRYVYDGLSQSAYYGFMPEFRVHGSMSLFLRNSWPQLQKNCSSTWLLDAAGERIFTDFSKKKAVFDYPLLLIGPERGFTEAEKKDFLSVGAEMVRVSATTLRVEFAVFASLAQMEIFRLK